MPELALALASYTTSWDATATVALTKDRPARRGCRDRPSDPRGGAVCSGRAMAAGVAKALSEILAPQGLTSAMPKRTGAMSKTSAELTRIALSGPTMGTR